MLFTYLFKTFGASGLVLLLLSGCVATTPSPLVSKNTKGVKAKVAATSVVVKKENTSLTAIPVRSGLDAETNLTCKLLTEDFFLKSMYINSGSRNYTEAMNAFKALPSEQREFLQLANTYPLKNICYMDVTYIGDGKFNHSILPLKKGLSILTSLSCLNAEQFLLIDAVEKIAKTRGLTYRSARKMFQFFDEHQKDTTIHLLSILLKDKGCTQ